MLLLCVVNTLPKRLVSYIYYWFFIGVKAFYFYIVTSFLPWFLKDNFKTANVYELFRASYILLSVGGVGAHVPYLIWELLTDKQLYWCWII